MTTYLCPENRNRTFFHVGMSVFYSRLHANCTEGVITEISEFDKDGFFANQNATIMVKLYNERVIAVLPQEILPAPRPLTRLNNVLLKHGPYTQDEFLEGRISCYDCGQIYGYYFQPERFTTPDKPISSTTCFTTDYKACMPLCSTREAAVNYLKAQKLYGHVQRYAADSRLMQGKCVERATGRDEICCDPPYPWVTAGITDIVGIKRGEKLSAHMSLTTSFNPPDFHYDNLLFTDLDCGDVFCFKNLPDTKYVKVEGFSMAMNLDTFGISSGFWKDAEVVRLGSVTWEAK